MDGGTSINDGKGGVITHEARANALAAYQNKLVLTTGHGTRSFKGAFLHCTCTVPCLAFCIALIDGLID